MGLMMIIILFLIAIIAGLVLGVIDGYGKPPRMVPGAKKSVLDIMLCR